MQRLIPDYITCLCHEISCVARSAGIQIPVHTIYFGGGTPSLIPIGAMEKILATIDNYYLLLPGVEITMEANPGTLSPEYLKEIHRLGVNRLSLGMQSADVEELRLLDRIHTYPEVVQSVHWARTAGFDNINLDLIFGLPDQHITTWNRSLRLAMVLKPEHFSLYALTLEHGTSMRRWVDHGLISEPDPDLTADMYELAGEILEQAGYQQYEISNWASKGLTNGWFTCQHNLQYWRGKPYLGYGAGAHGYANHTRTNNVLAPLAYIKRMRREKESTPRLFPRSPANAGFFSLSLKEEIGERMMMGLRLTQDGISDHEFTEQFGINMESIYDPQIKKMINFELLEWTGGFNRSLRLTKRGRFLGNQVFLEFI
jgi:oxygen-independent coproporphyrinogen-3 oxidase